MLKKPGFLDLHLWTLLVGAASSKALKGCPAEVLAKWDIFSARLESVSFICCKDTPVDCQLLNLSLFSINKWSIGGKSKKGC